MTSPTNPQATVPLREVLTVEIADSVGPAADRIAEGLRQALAGDVRVTRVRGPVPVDGEGLKPCPFCGAPGYFIRASNRVKCTGMDCNAQGSSFETQRAAIAAWNRRSPSTQSGTGEGEAFQARVLPWLMECFGAEIRAKQAAKPTGSALPVAVQPPRAWEVETIADLIEKHTYVMSKHNPDMARVAGHNACAQAILSALQAQAGEGGQ